MSIVSKPSVLLISVDALKPELAFNPEKYGIKLPNFNRLMQEGTYASKGVKSVFPSWTYCCHQSMITGTYPVTHGLYSNKIFDPTGKHLDAWYWFVSDKVPNLWSYAKKNGYLSVNIGFPTSVLAETDYNIPEYWRDTTELDSKTLDAVSYPQGLASEMEKDLGNFPCGIWDVESDHMKLKSSCWMIENKIKHHLDNKPFFMTTYFASYDDVAHHYGTYSKEALYCLEKTDEYIGKLIEKAKEITKGNIVICVVSDHGMLDNVADVRPNTLFVKEGLITLDEKGSISDWQVWCQRAGGAGYIKLKDKTNTEVRKKVETIIDRILNDEHNGIKEVMTGKEAEEKRKGLPEGDYILISKPGYEFREDLEGEFLKCQVTQKAQHGYSEELSDMKAIFFIEGENIEKKKDISELNLVDIAPTLAAIMGFDMKSAEGKNIL